ncbi:MAG: primosomal protein N', partial [Nitrospirae bacterium]
LSFKVYEIEDIIDQIPTVPTNILRLIKWVSMYYLCTYGIALKTALPSGVLQDKKPGKPRITYKAPPLSDEEIILNEEQKRALNVINKHESGVFLLHGVTGSGKTEVYMEAIASLPPEKQALFLVPEIGVTPQLIDRLHRRFGKSIAIYHSGLSLGERMVNWKRIRDGEVRIALGVRAAVFAPIKNLGLIVVDEEHEQSYKQPEGLRYNARDTAIIRAEMEGAKVILGSATPSIESFYSAKIGKFHYLTLKERFKKRPLPRIEILDMKKEEKSSYYLSKKLLRAIISEYKRGRQSLILINRRGYSPFFLCSSCGHTFMCKHCSITLTYHKDKGALICHYCGAVEEPSSECPVCGGHIVKFMGTGTQKVEEELSRAIKGIKIRRMDSDSVSRKLSHHRIVREMETGDINLLIGTQMIAKGHDFPGVTVAAVVSADIGLNIPDFRSAERTFQLLTQLSGRAGRGDDPGTVYIQTYNPDHYVFDFIKRYDYEGLYEQEVMFRKELSYPPFGRLIRIIVSFDEKKKKWEEEEILSVFKHVDCSDNHVEVIGPSPAPIDRLKEAVRWHILIKGENPVELREKAKEIIGVIKRRKYIKISVDVDPVYML